MPGDEHTRALLAEVNATDVTWPATDYLSLIREHADRRPDAPALVHRDRTFSFGELEARSNQLAHRVRAMVGQVGARVGVLAPRSADYLLAVLAIMKAGAAAVPLDPANPDPRIGYMVADSAVAAILVTPELVDRVPDQVPWLALDEQAYLGQPDHRLDYRLDPDTVTHLIYTSGSTGEPKAVCERHAALVNLVHWTARAYGVRPGDRASWLSTPGFAVQFMECMPYLGLGIPVHIGDPAEVETPEQVRDWLVAHRITHTMLVAAMAERTWGLAWPAQTRLRILVTTAERVHSWPPADTPFQVVMTYGATETTNVLSCLDLGVGIDFTTAATPESVRAERPVPVGRPIANMRVYLLDERDQPVPVGVAGRLHVTGHGLAAGYHGSPELTAAKFRPNPVADDPAEVLYDTGDLGRFRADGAIELLGRSDSQVKVRGYRVELGEVEQAVAATPGVREAVVVTRTGRSGGNLLIGYVVPDDAGSLPATAVREHVARTLPPYMVPTVVVALPRLPRLANGKVDLRALPDPPVGSGSDRTDAASASTPMQQQLAALWSDLFAVDTIGVTDDFFGLGGDSLLAFQLIERVRRSFGVTLTLPELHRSPTVAGLAEVIADRRATTAPEPEPLPAIKHDPTSRFAPFALNDSQQALWIGRGDAVELGNVGCHGYFEWESADLDIDRFRQAWDRLVARHDALRTVIRPDGTQAVLADPPAHQIPVTDLRERSAADADRYLAELREQMSHLVMDEHRWPLVDVRLSRLHPAAPGENRVRIHLSIDMLVADAWSYFQVIVPDLVQLYEDPVAELAPLELTFRDYCRGVDELTGTARYQVAQRYWLDRLAELPPAPQLPVRPAWQRQLPMRFDRVAHRLSPARWRLLKARAHQYGITPSGLLTSVFAEVLRAWSGQRRFTINFPLFNRVPLHPDVDKLVGDTTTTLLLAVDKHDGTFAARAQALQAQLWQDLEHRLFSGVRVLRELARRRGTVAAAMPVVLTSLLGHPPRRYATALGDAVYSISQTPQVSIDFQIFEIAEELQFNWDFLPALFPDGLIVDMFEAYCRVLHELADAPESWHRASFDLIPAGQRELRAQVDDTAAPVRQVLLPQLLADQARQRPQAPAVVCGRRRLSYGELYSHANRLGRQLRAAGVRPNQLVGVVMEPGWEQYAAVYGILTAGAAYLPIDPHQPTARLHQLIAAGQLELVLTQPWLRERVCWPAGVRPLVVSAEQTGDDSPLELIQGPTDLAYVLFTSGSTGEPKGVMVDHRGVVNHVDDVNRRLGFGPTDRAMCTAALHFDMSVFNVFGVIAAGATAVLPDPSDRPDPDHWLDLVRDHAVTFWAAVPPLLDLAVDRAAARGGDELARLRAVVLAGDWIPLSLPDRLRELAPEVVVIASGGPTETINWSIWYEVAGVNPDWNSIPYGKPMNNHRYSIRHEWGDECPVWVPGQMYDASEVGLAHGYWRDPERTASSFVTLASGQRAYATGDIGRYLPDGNLEILGRTDFQVKVGGHRIELGEIEVALCRHRGVRQAVVLATGEHQHRHLVAHLLTDGELDADELRTHLAGLLPAPMIPARYVWHEQFPLSVNGKIDRLRLQERTDESTMDPGENGRAGSPSSEQPADQLTRAVADVWQEVLRVGAVSAEDRFFDLGGNSMLAATLARRIGEEFGVQLPLRAVFDMATVAEMAQALRAGAGKGRGAEGDSGAGSGGPVSRGTGVPY